MFDLLRRKSALHAAAWAASALLLVSCGGSTDENPAPPPIGNTTFVLGASLSDNGNACTASVTACPPAPPYSPGIYSNGPLWVDTVVARLGASATPSLKGGTNYAFAGARTGAVPGAGTVAGTAPSVPSMLEQFNTLLLAHNNRIDPSALVIVDAVTFFNNINVALILSAASPANAATIATNVVTGGVTDIVSILNLIYNTGGRNVLVLNMVNAGKVPAVVAAGPAAAAGASQMAAGFNGALQQQITALSALPGFSIKVVDTAALFNEVQANPAAFGFTNATSPCFVPPPTGPLLCPTPNTYAFWDPVHPTYAAGQLLASRALTALGR